MNEIKLTSDDTGIMKSMVAIFEIISAGNILVTLAIVYS